MRRQCLAETPCKISGLGLEFASLLNGRSLTLPRRDTTTPGLLLFVGLSHHDWLSLWVTCDNTFVRSGLLTREKTARAGQDSSHHKP